MGSDSGTQCLSGTKSQEHFPGTTLQSWNTYSSRGTRSWRWPERALGLLVGFCRQPFSWYQSDFNYTTFLCLNKLTVWQPAAHTCLTNAHHWGSWYPTLLWALASITMIVTISLPQVPASWWRRRFLWGFISGALPPVFFMGSTG